MPGPPASLVEDQVLCVRITLCEALMVERGVCELREQTHTGKSNRLPESEGGVGFGGGRRMQAVFPHPCLPWRPAEDRSHD